jgi:hypothetical protein
MADLDPDVARRRLRQHQKLARIASAKALRNSKHAEARQYKQDRFGVCPVCQFALYADEAQLLLGPGNYDPCACDCGHTFHTKCLRDFQSMQRSGMRRVCPVCHKPCVHCTADLTRDVVDYAAAVAADEAKAKAEAKAVALAKVEAIAAANAVALAKVVGKARRSSRKATGAHASSGKRKRNKQSRKKSKRKSKKKKASKKKSRKASRKASESKTYSSSSDQDYAYEIDSDGVVHISGGQARRRQRNRLHWRRNWQR